MTNSFYIITGYRTKPNWTKSYVERIAQNCNTQKNLAKKAQEASTNLYLAFYVERNQPFIKEAVVCDVKDRSLEVIVFETGSTIRIPFNVRYYVNLKKNYFFL